MVTTRIPDDKKKLREQIEADTKEFLAKGKGIDRYKHGISGVFTEENQKGAKFNSAYNKKFKNKKQAKPVDELLFTPKHPDQSE